MSENSSDDSDWVNEWINKKSEQNPLKNEKILQELQLELGDIIEIFDPTDELLNNKTFIIDYIDSEKLKLINIDTFEIVHQNINEDKSIGNGTIQKLILKSRSDVKGYAKQHNLLSGVSINIYFDDENPFILSGIISDLVNDMIEITLPNKEVIYINFDYKGIPEDLPIQKIEIKEVTEPIVQIEQEEPKEPIEFEQEEPKEPTISQIRPPNSIIRPQKDMILKADQIIFGNEKLASVSQFINTKSKRFSLESQLTELLDSLLSTIPNASRTERVLNNIHILVERFKQLREKFSKFDEYGNVDGPLVYKANYKPLLKYFENFETNLYWIVPVVKNIKKIYVRNNSNYNENNDSDDIERNSDVLITNLDENLTDMETIIDNYHENRLLSDENKYYALYKELNPYFTPFDDLNDETFNILIEKHVMTNINVLVNNLGNFESSAFSSLSPFDIKKISYQTLKYNQGQTRLQTIGKSSRLDVKKVELTPSDILSIASILTLPEPFIRYSKINLPGTDILTKSNLHLASLNFWQLFYKKIAIENINVSENQPIIFDESKYVNGFKHYTLNVYDKNKPKELLYQDFLNNIVPKTKIIMNLMKKYMNGKLSIVNVVKYLEPFLIYTDNLTYKQYLWITRFLRKKILEYNKNFVEKKELFGKIKKKNLQKLLPFAAYPLESILNTNAQVILDSYGYPYKNNAFSNSEMLKEFILKDALKHYCAFLSLQNVVLNYPNDFEKMFNNNNDETNENCKKYEFAKMYHSENDLEKDNNQPIYFDKIYDDTNYNIKEDYEKELYSKTNEESIEFLKELFMKKFRVTESNAIHMAETLIIGKKKVVDGQYAVLIKDNENIYYVRKNNKWELDTNFDKINNETMTTDNNILCNLQKSCISISNKCEAIQKVDAELQKEVLNSMMKEFDKSYFMSKQVYVEKLKNEDDYFEKVLPMHTKINQEISRKYNKERFLLSKEIDLDIENNESPFTKYRDLILGQSDFVKKQTDIIAFTRLATRPANQKESKYWLYCKETGLPLLPEFKFKLATYYITNQDGYNDYVDRLIKEMKAVKSDDGDKWIDIHTGYVIKMIDFDTEEGYDEGFRISTREVLQQDEEEEIVQNVLTVMNQTPEVKMITNIIYALSNAMSVKIDEDKNFIINTVVDLMKNLPSEEEHKLILKKAAKKNKIVETSYESLKNKSLLYFTFCVFFISLQTIIPPIKTNKTFPGCKKSFTGYPAESGEDESGFDYLVCVVYHLRKNNAIPWNEIKSKTLKDINTDLKKNMNIIISHREIARRIDERESYVPDVNIEPEYQVTNWRTFLPPLIKFKLHKLTNISNEKEQSLLNELKTGNKRQLDSILMLHSKVMQFSLGIIESIQEAVNTKEKELILKKSNNELFLENACCQEKSSFKRYAISFFEEINPNIVVYNTIVNKLTNLIEDIHFYTTSSMISSNVNTTRVIAPLSKVFGDVTIFLTFIKCCQFRNLQPIPEDLLPLCKNKLNNSLNTNTKDLIKKIKENNQLSEFYINNFPRLLQLVNQKHMLDFSLQTSDNLDSFKNIITDEERNLPINEELLKALISIAENKGNIESEAKRDEIYDIVSEEIKNMKKKIIDYLKKYKSQESGLSTNDAIQFIQQDVTNVKTSKTRKNNDAIYNHNAFIRSFTINFVNIYPNIILNNTYKQTKIPPYFNISREHAGDLINIVEDYYKVLQKYFTNNYLKDALNDIQVKCKSLVELSKTIIFSDDRLNKVLQDYCFLKVVDEYTNLRSETMNTKILHKNVSNLLLAFLGIMKNDKDTMDVSYEDILERTFKSKEREKRKITERLKNLTEPEREVDTAMKINKLGVWSKGLQKGITSYDKNLYNEEREFMQEMQDFERINIGIAQGNKNNDEDNEDAIEENQVESLVDDEEANEDGFDEDYDLEGNDDNYDRYE